MVGQPPAPAGGGLRGTPGRMPNVVRYGTVRSASGVRGNGTTKGQLNGSSATPQVRSDGDQTTDRDQAAGDGPARAAEWGARIGEAVEFARRQMAGGTEVDQFGFDPEFNSHVLMPVARALYQHWFRVRMKGLAHVPGEGAALVVANHSGVLPLDAVMLQSGLHDEHPAHRNLRLLGADLVYELPVLSQLARKGGHTRAGPGGAHQLLRSGELVGVFPEGFRGIGKPFSERYKLQRFGRGGFAVSAIRARVPVIPCAIVGAEEIFPMVGNAKPLARLLGLPYFPITPLFPWLGLLGAVPLPSQWIIEFCPPVSTDGYPAGAQEDPAVIAEVTAAVRGTIQRKLDELLVERGPAFG